LQIRILGSARPGRLDLEVATLLTFSTSLVFPLKMVTMLNEVMVELTLLAWMGKLWLLPPLGK
jgi:hypothetical protein